MNYLGYEQCSTGEWESKFQSLNVWVSLRCHVFVSQVSDASVSDLCVEALCWARRLLPFCRFLNAEEALQDLVLSLLSELPPSHVVIQSVFPIHNIHIGRHKYPQSPATSSRVSHTQERHISNFQTLLVRAARYIVSASISRFAMFSRPKYLVTFI